MLTKKDITVGILAGGKATRMNNEDKGLVFVNGVPLIENLLDKLSFHSKNIIINAIEILISIKVMVTQL